MTNFRTTRPGLLVRIHSQIGQNAWAEIVEIDVPLIHAYAWRHGLQEADAAHRTQDVLGSEMKMPDVSNTTGHVAGFEAGY